MHVKRHLNRLFGSFRTSVKTKQAIVGVGGQSQWELVDHENDVLSKLDNDARLGQVKSSQDKNSPHTSDSSTRIMPVLVIPTLEKEPNVKKASLLKRTWSSRKRKETSNQKRLETDFDTGIEVEENLAGVVEEINATIGMMNQYASLHYQFDTSNNDVKEEKIGERDDYEWWGETTGRTESNDTTSSLCSSDPNEFEARWECLENAFHDDYVKIKTVENDADVAVVAPCVEETKMFIQAMEANIVSSTMVSDLYEPETKFNFQKESNTSTLRRSGRRLYNTLLRKKQKVDVHKNDGFHDSEERSMDMRSPNRDSWITRSFRKIVRRKKVSNAFSHTSIHEARHAGKSNNQVAVISINEENGPISRRFKKGFSAFGRSMMAASSVMPLPVEHPHPQDTSYPQIYYEDEDAIYEFRRYCQTQEWNRVQQQRTYQVGYCH